MSESINYKGCTVLIHDQTERLVANVEILEHNEADSSIEIENLPFLQTDDEYEILILTAPVPKAFRGKIGRHDSLKTIKLSKGRAHENRRAPRHKVTLLASIDAMVADGVVTALDAPFKAMLVDISQSGVRFRTVTGALGVGDRFQLHILPGKKDARPLTADVVYELDVPDADHSEFGCNLVNEVAASEADLHEYLSELNN